MNDQNQKPNNTKRGLPKPILLAVIVLACIFIMVPLLSPFIMAIPATQVLIKMEDTTKSDLTIKITGHQWRWHYEYIDRDISFFSAPAKRYKKLIQLSHKPTISLSQPQQNPLSVDVDNVLLIPSGRKVRALVTASDVIHSFWIPEFGTKKDAIPGFINELWFKVEEGKEGVYRGQCAELCGEGHLYMPIVVKVINSAEFDAWLASGGDSDGYAASKLVTD